MHMIGQCVCQFEAELTFSTQREASQGSVWRDYYRNWIEEKMRGPGGACLVKMGDKRGPGRQTMAKCISVRPQKRISKEPALRPSSIQYQNFNHNPCVVGKVCSALLSAVV